MYYVYAYIHPITHRTFYIGKGKDQRKDMHLKKIKNGISTENPWKDRIIQKLLSERLEPKIIILKEFLSENEAYEFEKHLIRKRFGNGVLTNVCEDNRPPCHKGKKFPDRKSPSNKGKSGRKWTDVEKLQHSLLMKEVMSDDQVIEKLSKSKLGSVPWNRGSKATPELLQKIKMGNDAPEAKKNRSVAKIGDKNPVYGKVFITNDHENRLILPEDVIPFGWRRGKTNRKV